MNTYTKEIHPDPEFYIVKFTRNLGMPYLLFIHGGPGFNCGTIEYLIEHNNLFRHLNHNIILYDQRNCGRSRKATNHVVHKNNIEDLQKIIQHLNTRNIHIHGLIGHSYGAKLLYDFYNQFQSEIPGIFISTASSILTPRLNNLILDLAYLKKSKPERYNETLSKMDNLDIKKIWNISEKLTSLFHENKERPFLYWANIECYETVKKIQQQINQPVNMDVFVSVRKDLYLTESNFTVNIDSLDISYLWINGFHDFIINGSEGILSSNPNIITFYKSSHYPHIEENNHFSKLINKFFKKQRN